MFGDLIAFEKKKGFDPIGEAISEFTNSNITHVAMRLYGNQIIESTFPKVRISDLSIYKDRNYYECELNNEAFVKISINRDEIYKFINKNKGKPYDLKQIGLFIPYILTNGKYKPKEDNNLFICSELISRIYEIAGIFKDINTSIISPGELFNKDIYGIKHYIRNVI